MNKKIMIRFKVYQICIFIISVLCLGLAQAQDAEWYESSCAWKIDSGNFGSLDLDESLKFEKYKGREFEYCQNLTSVFKSIPILTLPTVEEKGLLVFRQDGFETTCSYEVKNVIPSTDPLMIRILNLLSEEDNSQITTPDEIFELFNKKKIKDSVLYNCGNLYS